MKTINRKAWYLQQIARLIIKLLKIDWLLVWIIWPVVNLGSLVRTMTIDIVNSIATIIVVAVSQSKLSLT